MVKLFAFGATAMFFLQSGFALNTSSQIPGITLLIDPICKHYLNGVYTKRVQFQTDTSKIDFRYIPGIKEYDDELAISAPLYVYANATNEQETNLRLADIKTDSKNQELAFGIKVGRVNPALEIFSIKTIKQKIFLYLKDKQIDHFDLSGLHCDVNSETNDLNLYCSCDAEN